MRIDRIEFNLSKANRAEFFLPESEANPPLMMLVFDKEHIKNASKAYIEVQNLFGSHDITVSVRKKTSGAGISIISESKSEVINLKPMKAKGFIKFKEGLSKGTPLALVIAQETLDGSVIIKTNEPFSPIVLKGYSTNY